MSKYNCKPTDSFTFSIVEQESGLAIAQSLFDENCKTYIPKLNKGSAFDGRTPKFFCEPVLNLD